MTPKQIHYRPISLLNIDKIIHKKIVATWIRNIKIAIYYEEIGFILEICDVSRYAN